MRVITTEIDADWEVAERLPARRDFFLPQGGEKLWIPATVPGHVHSDLMRAGIIGDPFYRMQERACQWVDEADWTYRTTLQVTPERLAARRNSGRHFLHFHGLDTICRVFLNGVLVGTAENFFVPHRFDVTDALREGDNELRVEFDSALRVGRERANAYLGDGTSSRGTMSYFNFAPRAFIRKAQYMFGWDWGSELISCGIWQKVEFVTVPVVEIKECSYFWKPDAASSGRVFVQATVERHSAGQPLSLMAQVRGANELVPATVTVPAAAGTHQLEWTVDAAGLAQWALPLEESDPRPTTYRIDLRIVDEGEILAEASYPFGLRTVELVREPDADGKGESFLFRVNGVDTYIKGANWIPDHSFPALISKEQLRERLQQARDAGYNMLRIWGGGYYETEDFYDLCDELGILVWQDFPFACSMYPDDLPEFRDAVRAEAVAAIKRIRNHPSLALWCGGNENLELAQGRWAGRTQATEFLGDRLIHEVLPAALAECDPATPYWPNSPYGDAGEGNSQNEDYGDSHYWNVWHSKKPDSTGDWRHYAESRTRFSSEFGFASPAGLTAWDSCMAPEDKTVRSLVSQWHDKTRKGYETYLGFITRHYPAPQTFEDLIYYGQCNQADALTFGVEHFRRLKGRCWGTLFWQLNDCWQTHSWAVIDSMGEPKAAYYASKRFYAPLLLSLYRSGDQVEAHLVNDRLESVRGSLQLRLLSFTGEALDCDCRDAVAPANAASGVIAALTLSDRADAFVYATFTDPHGVVLAENFLLLAEPKDLQLPNPGMRWQIVTESSDTGAQTILTITAAHFAGYVHLRFDGLPKQPVLSDNFFPLAPGQTRTIKVSNCAGISAAELTARLQIRHL